MKTTNVLSTALSILLASASWATVGAKQVSPLTFDQLRAACATPERFHNQIAPKNIQPNLFLFFFNSPHNTQGRCS